MFFVNSLTNVDDTWLGQKIQKHSSNEANVTSIYCKSISRNVMTVPKPSVNSQWNTIGRVMSDSDLALALLAKLQGSVCQKHVFPSSRLQSRDFRFCILDPERWSLKLKTLEMFGCKWWKCLVLLRQFLNVADKCWSGRDTKQSCNFLVQLGILAFVSLWPR